MRQCEYLSSVQCADPICQSCTNRLAHMEGFNKGVEETTRETQIGDPMMDMFLLGFNDGFEQARKLLKGSYDN